jgi:hypothetical protein
MEASEGQLLLGLMTKMNDNFQKQLQVKSDMNALCGYGCVHVHNTQGIQASIAEGSGAAPAPMAVRGSKRKRDESVAQVASSTMCRPISAYCH